MSEPLPRDGRDQALLALAAGVVVVGGLWAAGVASAVVAGHPVPHGGVFAALAAFSHPGDPAAAWGAPVGPAPLYWTLTALVLVALGTLGVLAWRVFGRGPGTRAEGLARRSEVTRFAGPRALLPRGPTLRPSLARPVASDLGYRLGQSRGVSCWASVEDSMLVLGPPRSGKGHNLVIPMILDAPGAVVTTSTRPDNLTLTLVARKDHGPVAVFDPEGLARAPSLVPSLRWSPVRGCEAARVAMVRAAALVADTGRAGVENGSFWHQQTLTGVRCLLHAAALDSRRPADLYRWSHAAARAKEAVAILARDPGATPGWDSALDAIVSADARTRDSVWAMVANTFAPLADPAVLEALSPGDGEAFQPAKFLAEGGTLYLLGTASSSSATANLVAALVEDVIDAARRAAAISTGARLDPPVGLILDEAANYALPSLSSLMAEGGGSGITTVAVLQSLAQARDRWGRDAAQAIWDAAIAKVVLGGSANAEDLSDLSRLIGERDVTEWSETLRTGERGRSVSSAIHRRPILEPSAIRRIPMGQGLLLLRVAPPIMMTLSPWTTRPDAARLTADRRAFEEAMATPVAEAG